MFRQVRYQTGEVQEIINDMKNGKIPCVDVYDTDDFNSFLQLLSNKGIERYSLIPYQRNARDMVKEPEFEFRAAFYDSNTNENKVSNKDIMYIDVYFEPEIEKTYDSVGEI